MIYRRFSALTLITSLSLGLFGSTVVLAAEKADPLEARIARLERLLDSQGLVDILMRLESLQQEVQRLRGELEVQNHALTDLKKRQRDLYVDLDRRLIHIERNMDTDLGAPTAATGTAPTTPATPTTVTPVPTTRTTTPSSTVTAKPSRPSASTAAEEQKSYQKAFDLLRELRYDEASAAFTDFLAKYPQGRYAHIAQYWIGEASYAQRRFKPAIAAYQRLIDHYPNSPKLAEAMLKIGYSYYELKDYSKARASLEKLIKTYPGTTEASQGQNLLRKIKVQQQAR